MTEAEFGHSSTFGFVVGGKSAIGVELDDGGGFLEEAVAVKGGVASIPIPNPTCEIVFMVRGSSINRRSTINIVYLTNAIIRPLIND
ncbi:hypothetical protein [Xenorhabdus bovienii]|uniref:hypothetical protein n=1 Tax=Xenorhabdus bovienii TaxID=40576 RepID=UPI000689F634|nr:hypothetical protein [Xenorhabdus bovienii]